MNRIANIDLDGVVYPFHNAVTRLAEHWFSNFKYPTPGLYANPPVRLPSPRKWELWEDWDMEYEDYFKEFWPWAVEHGVFNQTVPPIPGSREGIQLLRDEGYEIRFVTHKPTQGDGFKHHAIRDAVQWLSWNHIEYDTIIFDGNKGRYYADIVIDDKPTRDWMQPQARLNFLFAQPWNADWSMNNPPVWDSEVRGDWSDLQLFLDRTKADPRNWKVTWYDVY